MAYGHNKYLRKKTLVSRSMSQENCDVDFENSYIYIWLDHEGNQTIIRELEAGSHNGIEWISLVGWKFTKKKQFFFAVKRVNAKRDK